ncbi:HNH endonuclease [Blastopirellula marina]|uniref:HNH endonuclease n=1 Tax=Blastopirellula marina TaxID=124 RepID=A0A2S8GCD2_9BACT|nr:HNH endonuclease signature motif containing protein [Blastopirellula marina]PQO42126.1 HNH endonuclease [Blastopirellula marina]
MDEGLRQNVRQRAGHRCEYCRMPESATPFVPFHAEHIIAQQHMGTDEADNLALACDRCNAYKGTNLASVDPETGEVTRLFHPRNDLWNVHFVIEPDGKIIGRTDVGRTTARLLMMNAPARVRLRCELSSDELNG